MLQLSCYLSRCRSWLLLDVHGCSLPVVQQEEMCMRIIYIIITLCDEGWIWAANWFNGRTDKVICRGRFASGNVKDTIVIKPDSGCSGPSTRWSRWPQATGFRPGRRCRPVGGGGRPVGSGGRPVGRLILTLTAKDLRCQKKIIGYVGILRVDLFVSLLTWWV